MIHMVIITERISELAMESWPIYIYILIYIYTYIYAYIVHILFSVVFYVLIFYYY